MLTIREINTNNEFFELREPWNTVLKKSNNNNIFLTWEWLWIWWKYYGKARRLMILLAEEHNKIMGIAPLMYSVYDVFGFKLKKIEFIATKQSDYGNFILTEKKAECLKLFINYLNNYSFKWDCIEFREIPETAQSLNLLRMVEKDQHLFEERSYSVCPYIPLPKSFEVYNKKLNTSMKKGLRRGLKRLKNKYKVEFIRHNNIELLQEAMTTFFELYQKRMRTKNLPAGFDNFTSRNFFLDLAQYFIKNAWLNLSFLTVDSKPIASTFSFEYHEKFYYYLSGFDPLYSTYGPGHLLTFHLIDECIRKELKEFDFLRGVESYKSRWNTLNRKNIELSKSTGFIGELYHRIKKSDNFITQKIKSMVQM